MIESSAPLPIFFTRDHQDYKGTKVALWENKNKSPSIKKPAHYRGKIGTQTVKLWESKSATGFYFKITQEIEGKDVSIGNAVAFTKNGFNTLSISLKYSSMDLAMMAKSSMDLKESPKPWKNVFFINIFADVSIKEIESNPEKMEELGFLVGNKARRKS